MKEMIEITEAMLVDFIDGKLSAEENSAVESWYNASEQNRQQLEQLYYIVKLYDINAAVKGINPDKSLAQFKERVAKRECSSRKSRLIRTVLRYAAVVALCAMVGGVALYYTYPREQMCEICAGDMEDKTIVLPDRSTVVLKANTTICFNSNFSKSRQVNLDGEALFDVVKMNGVPFVVKAKGADIVVKGTKFNFKAYSDSSNIEAVLIQGAIDFSTSNHNVAIKPNQKVVYDKGTRRVNIVEVDAELEVFGQRYFQTEPLGSVINSLEQIYNCRISFTDARMESIKFTGTIDRSNALDHTLKIVTLSTGTSFRREGDAIIIDR